MKELKEQTFQDNKSMKEQINELLSQINTLKQKFVSNLDKESMIVKNKEDIDLISSWINPFCKNIKYRRLYRATEDGDKTSDFHRLCDNRGPTLTIGRTIKGYIFGGFTMVKWDSNSNYKKDPNAFVFSLNQKKFLELKMKITQLDAKVIMAQNLDLAMLLKLAIIAYQIPTIIVLLKALMEII